MESIREDLDGLLTDIDYAQQCLQNIITHLDTLPNLHEKDCYGIKNVNFSLIEPSDENWEEYKQQRIENGFDESECWNLDTTIIKFILPRLKVFKKNFVGIPGDVRDEVQWEEIIDEIILGFELYLEDSIFPNESDAKIDKAFELFFKHFHSFWI